MHTSLQNRPLREPDDMETELVTPVQGVTARLRSADVGWKCVNSLRFSREKVVVEAL